MSEGDRSVSRSAVTDDLMHELFRRSRGARHQTLLANYRLADALRRHLAPHDAPPLRRVERIAARWWSLLSALLPQRVALTLSTPVWMSVGLPDVLRHGLRLHEHGCSRSGPEDADLVLLRTGVANEVNIQRWIERREAGKVLALLPDPSAALRWPGLCALWALLAVHVGVCRAVMRDLEVLLREASPQLPISALVPAWLVLLARQAPGFSWAHQWATIHLRDRDFRGLYFTMNNVLESAFLQALPGLPAAYVEHGFPRRDIPPLPCRQFVYAQAYARYLRSFDAGLQVEIIGLEYFEHGAVESTRTIVLAALQDWPQYGIELVRDRLNRALLRAREEGWKLVFRTRHYDTDAFARALDGPWDEISDAGSESFDACLQRVRPAQVWTTWSTAILNACAHNVGAVCFVHPSLDEHFVVDLDAFSFVVRDDADEAELYEALSVPAADGLELPGKH